MSKNLNAIILAAGMGKRMGKYTENTSKALLPVGGKTLLHHMSDFVSDIGALTTIVVGGYKIDVMKAEIEQINQDILLVENPEFTKQNLLSFAKGLEKIEKGDLFVCNADYIFMSHTVEAVKKSMKSLSIYASYEKMANPIDIMMVKIDAQKNLVEMSKELKTYDAIYTGMFFIPEKDLKTVKSIVKELLATADLQKATVEWLFKALLEKGHSINVADIGTPDWFEIDTLEEWQAVRKALE